ncbi:unnamed protein product [Brassica napus]|uniref:(rape) hypothetical protein n=1 Tax=Brassica napus TaxID=3708 RepID=A0A816IGL5_BRANA|nr:unnamed protein product [Brassica napus]
MTELPPGNDNGGVPLSLPSTSAEATAAGSKRFRRPSVRLGEIGGDQLYNHHEKEMWILSELAGQETDIWGLTLLALGGRCFLRSRSLVETSHDRLDRERRWFCVVFFVGDIVSHGNV